MLDLLRHLHQASALPGLMRAHLLHEVCLRYPQQQLRPVPQPLQLSLPRHPPPRSPGPVPLPLRPPGMQPINIFGGLVQNHFKSCQYVSKEQLVLKALRQQYKCLKHHFLEFYVGSYEEMINCQCQQCGQQAICRSFCRICSTFYCVCCRVPPCSKKGCPIGHKFNFQRIGAVNYFCDICGISTAVSNGGVYDDSLCNFGLCELCFEGLPAKYDESKPRAIFKNVNTECFCGLKLSKNSSVHRKSVCQLCRKDRECPKYCQHCEKQYCLACKSFDIFSDKTCSQDHQLIKLSPSKYSKQFQLQNQYGCMRCQSTKPSYYFDPKCQVRLCEPCMSYSMKVTTDKERPVVLTCDKNHILNYINGEEDYEDICCKCSKDKIIKLVCINCEEEERMYCFQCRMIPLRSCYFRHTLKFGKVEGSKECQLCRELPLYLYYCKKCQFYVCKGCVETSLNGERLELEAVRMSKMEEEEAIGIINS